MTKDKLLPSPEKTTGYHQEFSAELRGQSWSINDEVGIGFIGAMPRNGYLKLLTVIDRIESCLTGAQKEAARKKPRYRIRYVAFNPIQSSAKALGEKYTLRYIPDNTQKQLTFSVESSTSPIKVEPLLPFTDLKAHLISRSQKYS